MKFLIDAQLPPGLANLFRKAGHEASHVSDRGLLSATDTQIRSHAREHGLIVVTKDSDFAFAQQPAADRVMIVWIRLGNTTNRYLTAQLKPRLPEIVEALAAGDEIVEVR